VTQRYCEAEPFEGGKQAVAEAWRNLTAVGALPRAITDNLNFGNPEKAEIMGELIGCIEGIAEACRALDFPAVSGNVSLYNETMGCAIPPTPAIGGVGLIEDVRCTVTLAFKLQGEKILLIGKTEGWLGQSLCARNICGREDGAPPPVDLLAERRNGDFVRGLIEQGKVTAVHDVSDGGLAVALAEMAITGGIGASIAVPPSLPEHAYLFGEDQARYVLAAAPEFADAIRSAAAAARVDCEIIGVTGGDMLTLGGAAAILLSDLAGSHEAWLPRFMAGISP
jgi:phosphoribosylformylglycinamidine synthase